MPVINLVTKASDQVTGAIKQAEGLTLVAVSSVSSMVGGIMPALPTGRVAGRVPAPTRLVESGFGLATRVLDAQRNLALGLVDAVSPITEKVLPAAPAKPAAKKNGAAKK